jgi:hypothetical protein
MARVHFDAMEWYENELVFNFFQINLSRMFSTDLFLLESMCMPTRASLFGP